MIAGVAVAGENMIHCSGGKMRPVVTNLLLFFLFCFVDDALMLLVHEDHILSLSPQQ